MLEVRYDHDRAFVFAQSPAHDDYAEYEAPARELRAAVAELRDISALVETERFEHAWITRVVELVSDAAARPAVRRFLSQALDEAAVARGLLLQTHWHCPACGSPGSQWSPGCWQGFCARGGAAPRAHWDHCRVASRHELLTLMVSEGYDRVGALAGAAQIRNLLARGHRLVRDAPEPLAGSLRRWIDDFQDAHAARGAEILEVAARLGNAIELEGNLNPAHKLAAAIRAAGLSPTVAADDLVMQKEPK